MCIYDNISVNSPKNNIYISDESCRENQNKHFIFNNFFFFNSCRLRDNVEECCRAGEATEDHITRRMRFPCRITKAVTTHSEYVIIAFTWQKWLRKRAPLLLYTCMACLCFRSLHTFWYSICPLFFFGSLFEDRQVDSHTVCS